MYMNLPAKAWSLTSEDGFAGRNSKNLLVAFLQGLDYFYPVTIMRSILIILFWCSILTVQSQDNHLIKGLTLVAPPRQFSGNPFLKIKDMNSDWIAVIPYGFCRQNEPIVHYDHGSSEKRWWGESRKGVEETICMAKDNHIKVMLKPQIWVGDDWIGNLDYKTVAQWEKWESSYEAFIIPFAEMCELYEVEMLCIGTEIKQSVKTRPRFWNNLIVKIRNVYKGKLTYAANWDEYDIITFWSKLDFIGVDAYFPLCDDPDPDVNKMMQAWEPILDKLERTSKKYQKPILYTEYGYLSVDGCGGKTWELESNLHSKKYNPQAQATCLNVLLECSSKHSCWQGGFLWKWYDDPTAMHHGIEKDHSPQGKPGEDVVRKWYARL